jgi:RES domain-containing protein
MNPGRWNLADQEAIYTCTNRSTTILERLVHTRKDLIPSDYSLMTIGLSGNWSRAGNGLVDKQSKAAIRIYGSLLEARDPAAGILPTLSLGSRPFAVAVPSVVDAQWNIVLYPRTKRFDRHVTPLNVEPFEFDPRLFPEGTPKAT